MAAAAQTLPPSMVFADKCDWRNRLEATRKEFGIQQMIPTELGRVPGPGVNHTLVPVLQYWEKFWIEGDPVPDYSHAEEDLQQLALWNSSTEAVLPTLASQEDIGFVQNMTRRWRIAWRVEPPGSWNFFHMIWQEARYTLHEPDWSAPESITGAATEVWWQLCIDGEPPGYFEARPITWPGTDWVEADATTKDSGTGYGKTSLWPLWPWADAIYAGDDLGLQRRSARQGVVPGEVDDYLAYGAAKYPALDDLPAGSLIRR